MLTGVIRFKPQHENNMNTTQNQNSTATAGGHTKGPLTLRPSSNPANGTLWRDIIAEGEFGPMYIGEALEADALLFCQAPAMLEALKALLADPYLADPINKDRMAQARAIIAAVEGKQ
jgi:hypothetical protein